MRDLVLIQPERVLVGPSERESESCHAHREFEERLAECGSLAFRVAYGVLRHAADAEDVAQEALLKAYRNFESLREPTRFRGWLVRIAFRMALDRWRSVKRREKGEAPGEQPEPPTCGAPGGELATPNWIQTRIGRGVEWLPAKIRIR